MLDEETDEISYVLDSGCIDSLWVGFETLDQLSDYEDYFSTAH